MEEKSFFVVKPRSVRPSNATGVENLGQISTFPVNFCKMVGKIAE